MASPLLYDPSMQDDEADVSPFDTLPADVTYAVSSVLRQGGMPPRALALYARWWQLETWLRELAYVELRSRDGLVWSDSLGHQAKNRQEKDRQFEYMASPDWDDPLSYLDASKLFTLVDENWNLFEPSLLSESAWRGRRDELLGIRNRIGHLRRPHRDDLRRLEQMLRDLEPGAFKAITSYNRLFDAENTGPKDAVAAAYVSDSFAGARGLLTHAYRQYGITPVLSYTVRPWSAHPERGSSVSGTSGVIWKLTCHATMHQFDIRRVWSELSPITRQVLLHLLISVGGTIEVTLPAVEDPELIAAAIADFVQTVLGEARPYNEDELRPVGTTSRSLAFDSRIQMDTPWAFVDESMTPISFFGAQAF